jgi:hypothetical protein
VEEVSANTFLPNSEFHSSDAHANAQFVSWTHRHLNPQSIYICGTDNILETDEKYETGNCLPRHYLLKRGLQL